MKIRSTNTILYCKRWEETVAFYRFSLGLPVLHATDWFVEFALNEGARLSVADASRATVGAAEGKGITLSLEVQDVATASADLAAAGMELTELKDLWGAKVAYLHDPEGHRIEIWTQDLASAH